MKNLIVEKIDELEKLVTAVDWENQAAHVIRLKIRSMRDSLTSQWADKPAEEVVPAPAVVPTPIATPAPASPVAAAAKPAPANDKK